MGFSWCTRVLLQNFCNNAENFRLRLTEQDELSFLNILGVTDELKNNLRPVTCTDEARGVVE